MMPMRHNDAVTPIPPPSPHLCHEMRLHSDSASTVLHCHSSVKCPTPRYSLSGDNACSSLPTEGEKECLRTGLTGRSSPPLPPPPPPTEASNLVGKRCLPYNVDGFLSTTRPERPMGKVCSAHGLSNAVRPIGDFFGGPTTSPVDPQH